MQDDHDAQDSDIEIIKVEFSSKAWVKEEGASPTMDDTFARISEGSDSDSEDQETLPECKENPFKK